MIASVEEKSDYHVQCRGWDDVCKDEEDQQPGPYHCNLHTIDAACPHHDGS